MAKLERQINGNFDDVLGKIHAAVMDCLRDLEL